MEGIVVDVPLRVTCEKKQLSGARAELTQADSLHTRFLAAKLLVQQQVASHDIVCLWKDARGRPLRCVKVWRLSAAETVFEHPTPVFWHGCHFRPEIKHVDGLWYALGPLFNGWRHAQALVELHMEEVAHLGQANSTDTGTARTCPARSTMPQLRSACQMVRYQVAKSPECSRLRKDQGRPLVLRTMRTDTSSSMPRNDNDDAQTVWQ